MNLSLQNYFKIGQRIKSGKTLKEIGLKTSSSIPILPRFLQSDFHCLYVNTSTLTLKSNLEIIYVVKKMSTTALGINYDFSTK